MILSGFTVYRYALPFTQAVVFRGIEVSERAGLLLKLEAEEGAVGWGEVAPLSGFSPESLEDAATQLGRVKSWLMARPVTAEWLELEGETAQTLDGQKLAGSVRFGLELAVWNLLAAQRKQSLAHLLSKAPGRTVALNGLLIGGEEAVVSEAMRMRQAGYLAVKLKVGRASLEEDIRRVRRVREVMGADVQLRLDANRAWDLDAATAFVRAVGDCAVAYIEEPLADPAHLPAFVASTDVPVALDETLLRLTPAQLSEHIYARAVVLKPTLLGGMVPTLRMARKAVAHEMTPVISASFEAGVGTLGLLALAAVLGGSVPAGLDPYRWLATDVFTPRLPLQAPLVDMDAVMSARYRFEAACLEEEAV